MTVQTAVHHIACCNVCGKQFDCGSPYLFWSDTADEALAWVEDDDHWMIVNGAVVCPASDEAHNQTRGQESPVLLEPGPDAASINFA